MAKKVIPAIHIPLQQPSGSVSWVWYVFFQWLAENAGKVDLSDYFTKEETNDFINSKADENTIDLNSEDKFQTIGIKNKNDATDATSTIYDWVGTLAEYNAQNIATDHPDWLCFITDDINPDTTYTKAEADALFVRKTGNYNEEANGSKNFTDILRVRQGQLAPSTNTTKTSRIMDTYITGTLNTSNKNDGFQIFRDQNTSGDREIVYGSTFMKSDGTTSTWAEISLGITPNDLVFGRLRNTSDISVSNSGDYLVHTRHLIRVLQAIWPVGSIFITEANSCPLASIFGTWTLQSTATGRALWGGSGSNGGTTINAGLPNITGTFATARQTYSGAVQDASGAITGEYPVGTSDGTYYGTTGSYRVRYTLNASRSSSIYGNSSTVQPPAYRVNVWKRTA